jgi:hypothetical protein
MIHRRKALYQKYYDVYQFPFKLYAIRPLCRYLYESLCTLLTARPEGSIIFLKEASQAMASGVLHATEGTDGTHNAAESDGKCSANIHL